ncbi:HAD family hydrolase [Candidatus Micrarchaeota archaeon]|nr:HAD family hydrolase [Candidatus Micrarchaeota archaeon]
MKFKAIVFDWDGTLFDSISSCWQVYLEVFDEFGITRISLEQFREEFIGDYHAYYLFKGIKEKDLWKVDELWRRLFAKKKVFLLPHVFSTLKQLHEKKVKIALVSNGDGARIREELKEHHIHSFFNTIVTSDDVREFKPSPNGLIIALKRLGVKKSEVLYVGDSEDDVRAGKRAGIKTIGVLSGLHSRERLEKAKPDFLLEKTENVLELV